jgi:hypothetical protein
LAPVSERILKSEEVLIMADEVINYNAPAEGSRGFLVMKQISWAAIFAGVLVALAVEVLFLSFGMFIGFRMTPAGAGIWSAIWYFVGCFFSLMAGGWVAARLAANPVHGRLHGIVTWGLTTVATFLFMTALSWGVVTQSLGLVKAATLATASAVPSAVNRVAPNQANRLQEEAGSALSQAQRQAPYEERVLGRDVSNVALLLWIGFMIAACGSMVGGAMGAPRPLVR